ncbi:hypothetical protein MPTK1_8g16660 [Marchantia polymorpha subsp. ruderalis]|uniref:Uncharacterized protein n=1 Tax=Marchantia polymorpha TaxID=3197 RepID=A0A2R6X811_MARPO|nr:hypothetical protein MARPO_0030s0001 [Marchantia polymorpha]BBN20129.1 hypothetical protein Mp_8g16660 [Marchantia polymorpha subsp. ruderalis]|eukprot:PTQ42245.1 hypothetical protein MARPO_0030s0001 [Marchantia polymorpha]
MTIVAKASTRSTSSLKGSLNHRRSSPVFEVYPGGVMANSRTMKLRENQLKRKTLSRVTVFKTLHRRPLVKTGHRFLT